MLETGKLAGLLVSLMTVVALCAMAGADEPKPAGPVDFTKDVQPILKSACYQCHGPTKQKGKLRLDAKNLALNGGKSGKAIVPGHSDQSSLIGRITSHDDDERMPQDRDPLTAEQIATIKKGINKGANGPDDASAGDAKIEKHWALIPPVQPKVPEVARQDWARNDIDKFILARLEKEKITPSP